jgi:DNA-3-methyladenine glycosylase II
MQRISLTDENLDYGAQQLAAVDADLGRIYTRLGTPPLWAREPGFASLVHIILEQQISIKAAQTVFERLCAHLGKMSPQRMVSAGEEELKAFGLTRQKARYCFGLADRIHTGKLDLAQLDALSDTEGRDEVVEWM